MIDKLRPLTQEQRQDARVAAMDAVKRAAGRKPARPDYDHIAASKYPPSVTRLITSLCIVLLVAAFTPSAIRLYQIGSTTFGAAINNTVAMRLVGLATVLSAETGQIVFSLALATLGTTRSARNLLYTSMLIATLIALVGNIQVALPGHTNSPFAWLEAIAPPLLVLSTAYVLKAQILMSIEARHADEQAYQDALAEWAAETSDPERNPRWSQFYANAIRDALRKSNRRRKEVLQDMTTADWRAAVWREIQAEQWYEQPQPPDHAGRPMSPLAVPASGNGHHNGNGHS